MARSPNRDDGYGLMSSSWTGPSDERGRSNPPSLPAAPLTPPKDDPPFFRETVEAIASQMAQQSDSYRVPSGSTIACNTLNGRPDIATDVTLWPLPPMTIEEGVRRGLLTIFGYCRGTYEAALASIGEKLR